MWVNSVRFNLVRFADGEKGWWLWRVVESYKVVVVGVLKSGEKKSGRWRWEDSRGEAGRCSSGWSEESCDCSDDSRRVGKKISRETLDNRPTKSVFLVVSLSVSSYGHGFMFRSAISPTYVWSRECWVNEQHWGGVSAQKRMS